MKNTFGRNLTITLFGESHGEAIGAVIDGMPSGIRIDENYIKSKLEKRKAVGSISTSRKEEDEPIFLSGIKDGVSEGTPIAFMIKNTNVQSKDYDDLSNTPRPSHADYAAHIKYQGNEDPSGGGHFSGRLTAPLVVAGAICEKMLEDKGILIGSHIAQLYDVKDASFEEKNLVDNIKKLNEKNFAVIDDSVEEKMVKAINEAKENKDSVGGILETMIVGLEAGIGEPFFDSMESLLAHGLFSIPAVKGVEFGLGFEFADKKGSEVNDAWTYEDNKAVTKTNNNGGINGGISNGMPIRIRTVIKPTPSIGLKQETINLETKENTTIEINGRHDPAIIHRARIVVDAVCSMVLCDLLMDRYGNIWFSEE